MTFRIAWKALLRNKLRTALTMLGIIIGVGAVIAMLSIGNGAQFAIQSRIASMGTNAVHVFPGSRKRGGASTGRGGGKQLRVADWKAAAKLPSVHLTCPMVSARAQMVYGANNWSAQYYGTSPSYAAIREWKPELGRFFSEGEVRSAANVVVLGVEVRKQLFGSSDPVGATIRIEHLPFTVVGVMEEKGESGFGSSNDDMVLMPYTTAMRKVKGTDKLSYITVTAARSKDVGALEKEVVALLNERFRIRNKDEGFRAFNQAEVSKVAGESTRIFSLLLGGIASVSLLVGGIGIMNIMLVSVTERVREIGIRMAVGAKGRDILLQFLIESVVLSVLGGAVGILFGILAAIGVAKLAQWPAVVSGSSIWISFGFASFIGVFFGFYPALQASRLDPIEALRRE